MNKLILFSRNFCVAFALLLVFSCGETIPNIIFTTPQNEQEYFKDKDIDVKIILADTKGKKFTVQLYIDDNFLCESSNSPYYFIIKAGEVLPGKHIIKIKTTGVEALRTIKILEAESESPDFVTFTDGIIPLEWAVKNWNINTSDGVDDHFSLFTMTNAAKASTSKTCNKISFYLKGTGIVQFYVDKEIYEIIDLSEENSRNFATLNWKLYEFSFSKFYHTFAWELIQENFVSTASLDAINFYSLEP